MIDFFEIIDNNMDMSNPYSTKKFRALKAKWDKKLKSSGFEDIENSNGTLKDSTHPRTIKFALQEKEERETYYRIATQLLHTHAFANETEKKIWELHSEGIGVRTIVKILGITHHKIELVISNMQRIGKLR